MRLYILGIVLATALASASTQLSEAPAGFDDKSNGMVDDATHQGDRVKFDEVEQISDGLGPLYNAQSCRECHQNPTSGGASQITELRAGHLGPDRRFQNPEIPIMRGTALITGRSLINDRAICPNASFPDAEIQERVPVSETIRTTRLSLNLLGDGFVECVPDQTLIDIAHDQCKRSQGKICGQLLYVPVLEAPGQTRIGRFGWKDQQASLLSFSADAYLNEMGITSRLLPDEITNLCNTVSEPNDKPGSDGLSDIDHFARFLRATKAPPVDGKSADTPRAKKGSNLFDKVGCPICHVRSMTTAATGTKINGDAFAVPDALGTKVFHPFSDFLLHDIGTGDGIAVAMEEHYGRHVYERAWTNFKPEAMLEARNKVRTAPLWGVRMRPRLMHDASSLTFLDAILRHRREAEKVTRNFKHLSSDEREAIIEFLKSL